MATQSRDNGSVEFEKRKQEILNAVSEKLRLHFGRTVEEATENHLYKAVALVARDEIVGKWAATRSARVKQHKKRVYYLSIEFLIGRSLGCNLINLCQDKAFAAALGELGVTIPELEDMEPEAALGNGGLGRLAACFMDSLATLDLPAMGCGIRYEYGLFKQFIVDGQQMELPDSWLDDGNIWEVPVPDDAMDIVFGGRVVEDWSEGRLRVRYEDATHVTAVPYDIPVLGYDTDTALSLRLWSAKSTKSLDMDAFASGDYMRASQEKELAEVISKVLYPADDHLQGKTLRLKQHYFFTSATVQYIIKDYKKRYPGRPLSLLADKVVIHINDTHPALAIPELMRILMDEEGMGFDEAYRVTHDVFCYTNHTIMVEALEKWPAQLYRELLPRIWQITDAINERYCRDLARRFPGQMQRISDMAIIAFDQVRMANLAVAMSHCVNGVSELHAQILRDDLFRNFVDYDDKFIGITNGITPRRWLMKANPDLSDLLDETIGTAWRHDLEKLSDLAPFADDAAFRDKFADVKMKNKERLAAWCREHMDVTVDTHAIFDCQAKRLHEYKRQLLNLLQIVELYNRLKDDPGADVPPRVFFFAAKAAGGYYMAKQIIRLIHAVRDMIERNPVTRDRIRIVFLPNYCVSLAEVLMPAADVSEQISTAGLEASGTGNMKFMLNGALTIGTLDGANVEMSRQVGLDNIYIFGNTTQQNEELRPHYQPSELYFANPVIKRVLDTLISDELPADRPGQFMDVYHSLIDSDTYLLLADYDSYSHTRDRMARDYADAALWGKKAVLNTAHSGIFSSDRTIREYNDKIWHLTPFEKPF